jgi:hypothetical protein
VIHYVDRRKTMGVDVTVFVLATYSSDVGYVGAAFRLSRDRDLWDVLTKIPKPRKWAQIQLPQGAHSTYADGEKPKGYDDREVRYLSTDCYGSALVACKGAAFATAATKTESPLNREILSFVARVYADHDVVLFWH